jgi:serine/threonine protein kinase
MAEDDDLGRAPDHVGEYQILEVLGAGAFATVYRARHRLTGCVVALKAISKRKLRTMQEFELLQREVNLMKVMDHPFIASLFEVLDDPENFYLSIELVENGNLLDYINTNKGLSEKQASRIFAQLASVLEYLHREKRVVHRDLKAENVLLDVSYNIRVVDFGLSKSFSKGNPFLQTTCGSPAYVSPEIIREEPYTAAADVWSAGILLYAMVCGQLPFDGENLSLMLQAILSTSPVIPSHLSPELRSLLDRLLSKEPKTRITVQQILAHPWVAGHDDQDIIGTLRVHDTNELDDSVLGELRLLGYDTGGIMPELKSCAFNQRTAAYRMLRKKRICEHLRHSAHSRRLNEPGVPSMASRDRVLSLTREDSQDLLSFRKSDSLTGTSGLPKLGPKIRKRVGARPPSTSMSAALLK